MNDWTKGSWLTLLEALNDTMKKIQLLFDLNLKLWLRQYLNVLINRNDDGKELGKTALRFHSLEGTQTLA